MTPHVFLIFLLDHIPPPVTSRPSIGQITHAVQSAVNCVSTQLEFLKGKLLVHICILQVGYVTRTCMTSLFSQILVCSLHGDDDVI